MLQFFVIHYVLYYTNYVLFIADINKKIANLGRK